MMAKAAFMMGIKTVVVAHNPHHVHILQDALKSYVRENMAADLPHFTPHDRTERLQEVKPVRLAMWEKQGGLKAKKCSADQPQEPDVKRARLSMDWETQLDSLGGTGQPVQAKVAVAKAAGQGKAPDTLQRAQTSPAKSAAKAAAAASPAILHGPPPSAASLEVPATAQAIAPHPLALTEGAAPASELAALLAQWG